jgi:flavin reductase (DIM6/NTAB) family NADH-FMN oxidoreductase RutF
MMEFDVEATDLNTRYKLFSGLVVPRPIALVTSANEVGHVNAAPFSFFNILSHDPPILALGIYNLRPGELKHTVRNIRSSGEFVVNLVGFEMAEQMNICAIEFPPETDELAVSGLTAVPCSKVKVPRIAEAPVSLECTLEREIVLGNTGQRSIILAHVHHLHVRDGVVNDKFHVDIGRLDVIARLSGPTYGRIRDRFDMKALSLADWQRSQGLEVTGVTDQFDPRLS